MILGPPASFILAKMDGGLQRSPALIAGLVISSLFHFPIPLYAPIGPAWAIAFYLVWQAGPESTDAAAISWVRIFFSRRT
jgi:hypothetical protein